MGSVLLLLLVSSAFIHSQDHQPADAELFQWLPEGIYNQLSFMDSSFIAEDSPLSGLMASYDNEVTIAGIPLPLTAFRWQISASLLYRPHPEDGDTESADRFSKKDVTSAVNDDTANDIYRGRVSVISLFDSKPTRAELEKAGRLSEAGSHHRIVIYTCTGDRGQRVFIAFTPGGEMLIADSKRLVRTMIGAGQGHGYSFLDQASAADIYSELVTLDFPTRWTFQPTRSLFEAQADLQASEHDRDAAQEAAEKHLQYTLIYWSFDEVPLRHRVFQFGSEEMAARFFRARQISNASEDIRDSAADAAEMEELHTVRRLIDTRIEWVTSYDSELIRQKNLARKELQEKLKPAEADKK